MINYKLFLLMIKEIENSMLYKSLSGQHDYIFIRNLCDKTENII